MNIFRKPFVLLTLVAALSFTSCSDDSLVGESSAGSDIGGETGYLAFRIKSADTGGMTRAWNDNDAKDGDFSFGSEASGDFAHEDAIVNNIQANRVFFFDKDGNYHSSSFLSLTKDESSHGTADEDHPGTGSTPSTYPEIVYSATVKRTSDRGDQKWPEQCLVVLNGRPSRLNALLARAQADPKFNMSKFLTWVNKDFRDTDAAEEGLTLGLYKYTPGEETASKYYFTMTNSVFLDKDKDDKGENQTINATKIEDKLYPSSEKAADDPVTVYVERIMSKIEVGFSGYDNEEEGKPSYFEGDTDYFLYTFKDDHETNSKWFDGAETKKMKALITNWTINAVEYQTKLFKEIDNTWETEEEKANPFKGWNDYNHHRSYWAIDPNYRWDAERYPTQYRTSFGGSSSTKSYEDDRVAYPAPATKWSYGENTKEENNNDVLNENYPWALDYKSFDAIKNKSKYKYCLENTFEKYTPEPLEDGQTVPSYVPQNMIMGSHVLIQARLVSEDDVIGTSHPANLNSISDKYYYSDRYYDEETYIQRQVAVINEVLGENVGGYTIPNIKMWGDQGDKDFIFQNIAGGLWIKKDNTYKRVVSKVSKIKTDGDEKEIDNPNEIAATDVFTIAPAYIDKGDGKVTIALKGDNNGYGYGKEEVNLYYVKYNNFDDKGQPAQKVTVTVKDPDTEQEQEIEEDNIIQFTRNQLVSLIYRVANTADCFKNGMMYYAIPIQHFLAAGKGKDYDYKYEGINTGDYGVVRNHWYKFTINAIAKPGIPVHDPDQPIIPNYDMEDRYIGFEVVILPWHIVDNGNVTLGQ